MTSNLKVAMIGAGWVSCNRHLPALFANPDVSITGIVAKEESIAAVRPGLLSKYGITRTATSLDSALVEDADAVMIGTPPTTHVRLVMEALESGKHVLVEKPMALTVDDADRMVAAAKEHGKTLAVVHNLNYCRATVQARRLLEQGHLGALKGVLGLQSSNHLRRLPVWYPTLPLGLFTDEAAHLIYLMQSFLPGATVHSLDVGPPVSVQDNTPDIVTIGMRSSDGRPGTLHMSFIGSLSEWALVLQGDKRTAIIDLFRDVLITIANDQDHDSVHVLRTTASAVTRHLGGIVRSGVLRTANRLDYGNSNVVARFVAAVRSGQEPSLIAGSNGRDVVEVIDAAHRARD